MLFAELTDGCRGILGKPDSWVCAKGILWQHFLSCPGRRRFCQRKVYRDWMMVRNAIFDRTVEVVKGSGKVRSEFVTLPFVLGIGNEWLNKEPIEFEFTESVFQGTVKLESRF